MAESIVFSLTLSKLSSGPGGEDEGSIGRGEPGGELLVISGGLPVGTSGGGSVGISGGESVGIAGGESSGLVGGKLLGSTGGESLAGPCAATFLADSDSGFSSYTRPQPQR